MRYGRTTTVEKVLESEPAGRLVYTVVKGIPVRNYRAEVTLRPEGDGTHIRWSARWDRTLPGRIVRSRTISIAATAGGDGDIRVGLSFGSPREDR